MLCYGPGQDSTSLQIYSDADYAGDVDSARSTSGHAVFVGKCLVNWSSKRQPVVAKSTTEAEYIAANEAGSDGVWFRNFMSELGYPPSGATTLWLDSLLFVLERTRSITVGGISCLSITGCGSKLKTRSFVWNMFLLFLCGLMFLQNRLRRLHTREFARFLGLHLNQLCKVGVLQ